MATTDAHALNPRAYFRQAFESLCREIEEIRGRDASHAGDAHRLVLAERELRIVESELATLERTHDASRPPP